MSAAVTVDELVTLASAVCDGRHPVPGMSRTRAACLIARQALGQIVDALLARKLLACPEASMRARLICLGQAYADDPRHIGYRADTAWRRLSVACHHHAYELSPASGEARALIDDVRWLAEQGTESV